MKGHGSRVSAGPVPLFGGRLQLAAAGGLRRRWPLSRAASYTASARLIEEVIAFTVASMVEGSMPMPHAWEPLTSANT